MVARKARLEDAAALYGLVCLYSRAAPPREVFDAYYALALEDGARRLLIAWEGDEAVGFADAQQRDSLMLGKKVGGIQDFFVREDRRRRNVGTALLVTLTTQLKAAGCAAITASCRKVDGSSQEFLEKRGFVKERYGFLRTMQ